MSSNSIVCDCCRRLPRLSRGYLVLQVQQRRAGSRICANELYSVQRKRHVRYNSSQSASSLASRQEDLTRKYQQFFRPFQQRDSFQSKRALKVGDHIKAQGILGKPRTKSKEWIYFTLMYEEFISGDIDQSQSPYKSAEFRVARNTPAAQILAEIPSYSPVLVEGNVVEYAARSEDPQSLLMELSDIHCYNEFPRSVIISDGVRFPPNARHLQLKFHPHLAWRLRFRSMVYESLSRLLTEGDYHHIETPMLFKPTPEGAREFLVPLRRLGTAYALPQSPQQYKQVLMASGISRYFQWARCFRDEDLRADRQPEFTQLDMERAWATGETIMKDIEALMERFLRSLSSNLQSGRPRGTVGPTSWSPNLAGLEKRLSDVSFPFVRMSYKDCMDLHGSDKPDLRIPNTICRVDDHVSTDFIQMITKLENPIVEAWKVSLDGTGKEIRAFVTDFMKNLSEEFVQNPEGGLQILVHDTSKPQRGFSSLGPAALDGLEAVGSQHNGLEDLKNGDIVLFQARANMPHEGGSTKLGELRNMLYHAAVEKGLLERDTSFRFLWVNEFPLFSPNEDSQPGQGGTSGFSATHHPFTAPLTDADFELLFSNPLAARADHYDLVCNGVELGGGSRRIHVAEIQEFVFRDILQMSDERIGQFSHLLEALRCGCPPHAGFAFGFDRLCAVLSDTSSVRDVIAFPKSMKGEDLFVKSPGRVTNEEWKVYNLQMRPKGGDGK